jgi:hypothetical protein
MNPMKIEWEEFRAAIHEWIAVHPEEVERLLQQALRDLPTVAPGPTAEAQWASRWARALWARANLDPPRPG